MPKPEDYGANTTSGDLIKVERKMLMSEIENIGNPITSIPIFDMGYHTSDMGNVSRFFDMFGGAIRYSSTRKKWLHWNGKRWEWNNGTYMSFLAKECVKTIYQEAADTKSDNRRQELGKHALKSESERAISAIVELMKSERGIHIELSELDTDNWLLNCQNGCVDLRSGDLKPHDAMDYITRILDVDFDPEAECPMWMKFLGDVTDNNGSLQNYLQRAVGYSLTGDCRNQVLFFLYGLGNNGKSTFLTTIRKLLGEYAQRAATDTFLLHDKTSGPRESLADLKGKRFVTASELEDGRRLAVSLVKDLTGGESIKADRKYEHQFEYLPTFKIWLGSNHKPTITDTTLSIWRRVKLIPFTVSIKPENVDTEIAYKLESEYEGILAWAIRGVNEWHKIGLEEPEIIIKATAAYKSESDILHDFIEDTCLLDDYNSIPKAELREAYEIWAKENHLDPITQRTFRTRLIEKGITEGRNGKARFWKGIKLAEICDNPDNL